jgi:hypothetical protein
MIANKTGPPQLPLEAGFTRLQLYLRDEVSSLGREVKFSGIRDPASNNLPLSLKICRFSHKTSKTRVAGRKGLGSRDAKPASGMRGPVHPGLGSSLKL